MSVYRITPHSRIGSGLFPGFVAASEHMRSVMKTIQQVARFDANVFICGESGTGKELLARIVHYKSNRRDRPFVPVNCGTLSGTLFESKLFGHEAGAFTGAIKRTRGRFEQANHGTLFLDEVSEIALANQVSFLRVLEDGCFRRIGGETLIKVDVRIIAATNKDLAAEVKARRFRKDLYYRLQVIPIYLLPLRERREDILHLVYYFLERFAKIYQKESVEIAPDAMKWLVSHDWPGNIRQLKNFIERVFLMATGPVIHVRDFPEDLMQCTCEPVMSPVRTISPFHNSILPRGVAPLRKARERVERTLILRALRMTHGERAKAAELLEIKPRTLRQKISDYGIEFPRMRRKRV